ncbi:MAG: Rrf2 family transcriptional regulator [Bacteroidetes bacterium]|jgi:Rrf2 family protein|nr:Rrf2 family transcriptional regulator [Bacteroidota bacterium]
MSIIFSRQCEYALQAVLYLALQPRGTLTSSKDLTTRLGVPYHFLGKIMQSLTRKGLLRSQKGSSGGFALALPPKDITLFHIVEAIDGVDFTKKCVLGFPECSGKNPCAVHHQWAGLRENIYEMLVRKNIAEMAKETKKPEFRAR